MFELLNKDGHSNARLGRLTTKTGSYETPFFMPVATKGAVKLITPMDLEEMGASSLISNAFLLYLKPGLEVIEAHGDIHDFMQWKRCIFTDCGGFQILSLQDGFLKGVSSKGLVFKSPYDGISHTLNPAKIMEIEARIGSDVAMALDHMPRFGESEEKVIEATNRTHEWAKQCIDEHKKYFTNKGLERNQLLFGIAQGGTFPELRKKSMEQISALEFDGIALGGLCIGEPREVMHDMIECSISHAAENKPRYLMGVGTPSDLLRCIKMGVDIFDSVFPTRNARHAHLFTRDGPINIDNAKFKDDMKPIDAHCTCFVCQKYTRSYMHHLFRTKEPLGLRIASYHNVYFLQELMKETREALRENRFDSFSSEFIVNYEKNGKNGKGK